MNPALPADSSVSALRCVPLQLDATLTNLARSLFARRVALRQDAALCAMFVGARSEASTHGPLSERNAGCCSRWSGATATPRFLGSTMRPARECNSCVGCRAAPTRLGLSAGRHCTHARRTGRHRRLVQGHGPSGRRELSLARLAAQMVIKKVLTDNGSQFTDRFTSAGNKPRAITPLTSSAPSSASSAGSLRHGTRRPTAWSSVSTKESAT